jgi:hypothetical protein
MDDKDEIEKFEDERDPAFDDDERDDAPFTTGDFHMFAQKQILNATFSTLAETKMDWALVAPFLEAAREVCAGDIEETARLRIHTLRGEGDEWVEAEEAYLGITVNDRDTGEEWLSETYWLSEIATADNDPAQVREIVRALERTIAKINRWLETNAAGDSTEAPPPA